MEDRFEAFVASSEIEVPDDLVEAAVEQLTAEVFHGKRYEYMAKGRTFMPYDIEMYTEDIQSAAYTQVKTQLVLEDIIRSQAFEVTKEELEKEAHALAKRQQMPIETVRGFLGEDMASLKNDILVKKAIAFITG